MRTRNWTVLIGLALLGLGVLAFRPVPIPDESDCAVVTAIVVEVYEAGTKDVGFKLKGLDKEFYINRGLERGLVLEKLKADLTNEVVVIKYPKYWTPLNPTNSIRHVSKLEFNGQTVFTEID